MAKLRLLGKGRTCVKGSGGKRNRAAFLPSSMVIIETEMPVISILKECLSNCQSWGQYYHLFRDDPNTGPHCASAAKCLLFFAEPRCLREKEAAFSLGHDCIKAIALERTDNRQLNSLGYGSLRWGKWEEKVTSPSDSATIAEDTFHHSCAPGWFFQGKVNTIPTTILTICTDFCFSWRSRTGLKHTEAMEIYLNQTSCKTSEI